MCVVVTVMNANSDLRSDKQLEVVVESMTNETVGIWSTLQLIVSKLARAKNMARRNNVLCIYTPHKQVISTINKASKSIQ